MIILRHNIFISKRRYWQIFKSALVYLFMEISWQLNRLFFHLENVFHIVNTAVEGRRHRGDIHTFLRNKKKKRETKGKKEFQSRNY